MSEEERMSEWAGKAIKIMGRTIIDSDFSYSPADWLNELQKHWYLIPGTVNIYPIGDRWVYVLVRVVRDLRVQPNAALYVTASDESPTPVSEEPTQ